MKHIVFLLLSLLFLGTAVADENTPTTAPDPVILVPGTSKDDKKRTPSAKRIILTYQNNSICAVDMSGHSMLDISMNGANGSTQHVMLTEATPTAYVNLEPGCYAVTCTAEDGSVYVGELTI